ncbi:MAG: hypothetical protein PHG05_03555 [Candidatus Nanoarchaeia archaeon]|nr:hypothetical protein [Candidatus Nanoarchaeia archaeon]
MSKVKQIFEEIREGEIKLEQERIKLEQEKKERLKRITNLSENIKLKLNDSSVQEDARDFFKFIKKSGEYKQYANNSQGFILDPPKDSRVVLEISPYKCFKSGLKNVEGWDNLKKNLDSDGPPFMYFPSVNLILGQPIPGFYEHKWISGDGVDGVFCRFEQDIIHTLCLGWNHEGIQLYFYSQYTSPDFFYWEYWEDIPNLKNSKIKNGYIPFDPKTLKYGTSEELFNFPLGSRKNLDGEEYISLKEYKTLCDKVGCELIFRHSVNRSIERLTGNDCYSDQYYLKAIAHIISPMNKNTLLLENPSLLPKGAPDQYSKTLEEYNQKGFAELLLRQSDLDFEEALKEFEEYLIDYNGPKGIIGDIYKDNPEVFQRIFKE